MVDPPELTSARIYSGPGSGQMFSAAQAWNGLAAELRLAASSFESVTANLMAGAWQGAWATAMAAVATPHAGLLQGLAGQAEQAAAQARVVASAFEAVRAATVHPALVAANRAQFVSLALSNIFGQNAPAIAAVETDYEEMWAQDVTAMVGYHSTSSAAAEQLTPFHRMLAGLSGRSVSSAVAGGSLGGFVIPGLSIGNRGLLNLGLGNAGNLNLGWGNAGNLNLGSGNTGGINLGSGNTGSFNPGWGNAGKLNLGSGNIGNMNLGSGNTGILNVGWAPALLISGLVSWVDDLWCRAIGAGV
ncbi:PPE family protein [Mycobacterium ulcerans str. Harvey]|uniref:PPE family protein n=1 Tax=Mycobacterium ulcerans str. Harvey TaxID=1299332 RepID=A0ABP3A5V4_MYCUL|nr:PPE family protein [Mycobacterium ulcerans str. Harvey]